MKKTFYFFLTVLIFATNCLKAQQPQSICGEDAQKWKLKVIGYIKDFEYSLKKIANAKTLKEQKIFIDNAYDIFVPEATIEVSKYGNSVPTPYPIKKYLESVVGKYNQRYSVVSLAFVSMNVSDLKEVTGSDGEKYYEGTFEFVQKFCGQKKSTTEINYNKETGSRNWDYCDKTKKQGKFTIKKVTTISGTVCVLKFHDISVESTTQ